MPRQVVDRSETLATFAYFRKKSPTLSIFLIALMAFSVLGMSVISMVERGQEFLIPVILLMGLFWSSIYVTSNDDRFARVRVVAPRVFLFIVVAFFLTGFVRETPSVTAALFVFPFILLSFLTVPAREAALWSVLGVVSILGIAWSTGNQLNNSADGVVNNSTSFVFALTILAQLSITYLLNGSARASASVAEDREAVLIESNARYETLFESIDEGLVITDGKGIVNFANETAFKLLGLEERQLLGSPITGTVYFTTEKGEDLPLSDHPFNIVSSRQTRFSLDFTSDRKQMLLRGDGSSFLVAYSVSPIFATAGLSGTILLFRDISEIARMDKAKTEFVSLASHQLRTPLSVISWYTEKLMKQRKGDLNKDQLRYMREIEGSNTRMSKLVNELLSVSRAELGKVKVAYEGVDTRTVIQQLYNDVHRSAESKGITMHVTVEQGETMIKNSDESLVEAIVQNMLTNAIKYSSSDSTISVHLEKVNPGGKLPSHEPFKLHGVLISVKDSGVGIPQEQASKIFTKMFRADNVQAMNVDGTGLGLYLSKKFSEVLQGDLWFESEEGVGTTFYLFLPFESEVRKELSAPNNIRKAFERKRLERKELFS